jgi:hypothetical protein
MSIGRITLPLLMLIIIVCKVGATEMDIVVNPKPIFKNRTSLTSEATAAPAPISTLEQSQVNEHLKETLDLLNSMTPKQRAEALAAMQVSESALDRYVCKMITNSDEVLIRHMNEKLNLIKSIPAEQQPEIVAAMKKSNNIADRNLAAVIMKNSEKGGDKNEKRLQAMAQLGPHDRAELIKRMSNSPNDNDKQLANIMLASDKNGGNGDKQRHSTLRRG